MKKALGVAVAILVLVLAWVTFSRSRRPAAPEPAPSATTAPGTSDLQPRGELGACDQQPNLPALPDTLSPASNDIAAIIAALDAALNDRHKAWLRCFTFDEELLARAHFSIGRWLRGALRLRQAPVLTALGATSSDDASSVVLLVYAAHLRGEELSLEAARKRRHALTRSRAKSTGGSTAITA